MAIEGSLTCGLRVAGNAMMSIKGKFSTPAHEMIRLLLNAIFPMITWSHHGMTVAVRVTCFKFCLLFAVLETKHIKENPRVLHLSNVAVKQVTGVRGLAPPFLIPSSQIQRPCWNFPSQCFIKKKKIIQKLQMVKVTKNSIKYRTFTS